MCKNISQILRNPEDSSESVADFQWGTDNSKGFLSVFLKG
jgi:hypothetical protein